MQHTRIYRVRVTQIEFNGAVWCVQCDRVPLNVGRILTADIALALTVHSPENDV